MRNRPFMLLWALFSLLAAGLVTAQEQDDLLDQTDRFEQGGGMWAREGFQGRLGGLGGLGGHTASQTWGSSTQAMTEAGLVDDGDAVRIFAGSGQFPPEEFGAYAIVAFKSAATSDQRDRHLLICEAYRTSIPEVMEWVPLARQLVTVWPISTDDVAGDIQEMRAVDQCAAAVDNYGIGTAIRALSDARRASVDVVASFRNNRGPFLLAWNPASAKGEKDTLILRMDLSDVDLPYQARQRFGFWVQEIEARPELWLDGWQTITLRQRVAETADRYGHVILEFFN